jgi:hypothetical protein
VGGGSESREDSIAVACGEFVEKFAYVSSSKVGFALFAIPQNGFTKMSISN